MDDKLREAYNQMIIEQIPEQTVPAKVVTVNDDHTCDVKLVDDQDVILYNVRLKALVDGKEEGIIPLPVVNSDVLVSIIKNNKQANYVSCFSEIEDYLIINSKGIKLQLNDILNLNGDEYGGLIKIENLVSKINALEIAIDTHIHSGVTTGTGVTGVATPLMFPIQTQVSDLENEKVKHG